MGWLAPKIEWHFDNGASSKIDDVLAGDVGLLHGGGLQDFSVSPSPLWVKFGF